MSTVKCSTNVSPFYFSLVLCSCDGLALYSRCTLLILKPIVLIALYCLNDEKTTKVHTILPVTSSTAVV